MTEDDLTQLLRARQWTLHRSRKASGVYLEATRKRRRKIQSIYLCSLKDLPSKTETDIVVLLDVFAASAREGNGDAVSDASTNPNSVERPEVSGNSPQDSNPNATQGHL